MKEIKKITKVQAIARWNANMEFWMVPCNMRFDSGFCMRIDPAEVKKNVPTFDRLCNAFLYYNCDSERGRYPHYYYFDDTAE